MDAQYTGKQISRLRKSLNLTQRELAERLHVTDKAVSKWERGVNFPDLGLMENLAEALGTTPACLLGLEEANQAEMVSALVEISQEQLEEARRDLRVFSWGSVVTALLLALCYHLTQKRAVEVYFLLHTMITVLGIVGFGYLFKYGQIKKWDVGELATFYAAMLALLIYYGYQFITGHYPPDLLVGVTLALAAIFAQIHFLQVMKPKFIQLLPLILSAGVMVRQALNGSVIPEFLILLLGCAAGCVVWKTRRVWLRKPRKEM